MRAGGGFGMVLHAEDRQRAMAKALERLVVQVPVGAFHRRGRQRVRVYGESVVVGRDFDFTRGGVHHRMVSATVSKLQLVGLAAESQTQHLMSQADAEDGLLAKQAAD